MRFDSGSTGAIAWADIAWSVRGVQSTDASVTVADSTIRESSSAGVQASGGTVEIRRSALTDNTSYGLYATGGTGFTVDDVSASGSSYGVYADAASIGTLTGFDNVTFQSMDAGSTQLTITNDGPASPYAFGNIDFLTAPTTGLYIQANETGGAPALTINITSTTPGDGSANTAVSGGAVVNWL